MREQKSGTGKRRGHPSFDRARCAQSGKVIRRYRTQAGMTQSELAERRGVSTGAVGYWEQGTVRPDMDTLIRLHDVLHMPVAELLGVTDEPVLSHADRGMLNQFHALNPRNRETVLMIMDRMLTEQEVRQDAVLRQAYMGLTLYEESAAAGVSVPMREDAGEKKVYVPSVVVPLGTDCIIHVNGDSMEPTYPNGSYVYVNTKQGVQYGQTGIFIVSGASYIKEYEPEGLVSHNARYKTIRITDGNEVRCFGCVTGIVGETDMARGELLEKLELAFSEGKD